MKFEAILLSFTKSIRSFIFTSLAITIPYFLASFDFSSLEIGIVILVSLAISTIFLYVYTAVRIMAKRKLLLMALLFLISLTIFYLEENVIFLFIALIVGGFSLSGRDLTANQSIEQYTMSLYTDNQNQKNSMFAVRSLPLKENPPTISAIKRNITFSSR